MKTLIVCSILMTLALAHPQREGAAYTNEAIRQAQQTFLIPKDAQIQNVQEGIELGAYEAIPGNQRINLFEILGDQVPSEVINNLQSQVDQIDSKEAEAMASAQNTTYNQYSNNAAPSDLPPAYDALPPNYDSANKKNQ